MGSGSSWSVEGGVGALGVLKGGLGPLGVLKWGLGTRLCAVIHGPYSFVCTYCM